MPRIFLLYNLIYSIFLSFLPKNLRHYLPKSHTQQPQQQQNQNDTVSQTPPTSRMNPEQLQRIFQMFDKNNDGTITKHELNESLQNMNIFVSDEDLVRMIDKVDVNDDGCVDLEEFGVLYKQIMDNQQEDEEEDMREAFNVFDQNRDGFIAVEELRSVLESLGLKQGKVDDCRRMIMKVDVDGDGRVSFVEFKEMMKAGGFFSLAQS